MKTNTEILQECLAALSRATDKVKIALSDTTSPTYSEFHSASFAAAKRAALDCKMELTKLTQSSAYKWRRDKDEEII